ncbi:uncharacterized protein LOC107224711 [Neodiprion lecontei]|uniref:Uncharacterized protein LOC107224711 n=1 Tax=Neodiprion lecontei TaxID=441921 RepID=A0ABM3FUF4_NEOLC|nr:uncharacterized protein LOC107224711 [Neodiprion lecontei]XP_046591638.1 uncharacterized protein LOC107224711 [Neodiprion lecontei]
MRERNLTVSIWICWIILRVCADVGYSKETGHNNTWREWNFSPPQRTCVKFKFDSQSSSANLNQNNQCDYEPKSSEPPSWLQHQQSTQYTDFAGFSGIDWNVTSPRENFNLTLLAKPHVKNKKECPCDPTKDINLLQNTPKAEDSSLSIKKGVPANGTFIDIFTGCYYFVMTNREEKSWLWGPYFYNTTYPLYDTTLKCHFENISQSAALTSRALPFHMTIRTTCLQLNLELWEIDKEKFATESDLNAITSPATQICHVRMNEKKELNKPICKKSDTNLSLSWPLDHENLTNGAWSIKVEWEGLKQGDVRYFAQFSQTVIQKQCRDLWLKVGQWRNYALIGRFYLTDFEKPGKPKDEWNLDELSLISVGVLLAVILLFWMIKFFRIQHARSHTGNDVPFNTISPLLYKEKPNRILIIYTKGPDSFMEEMRSFRDNLKERCGCSVYDLQSDDDNDLNVEFGSNEWIDRLLKHGCRVIWVDTPQFRSLVENDKSYVEPDEDYIDDFRDTSIPFALATSKTLYQDPITQYRDHFIVRWNGFEVTDGPDDPLAVISPHTRFLLPEHFDELCSHLKP